jgi:hypothetical protein
LILARLYPALSNLLRRAQLEHFLLAALHYSRMDRQAD